MITWTNQLVAHLFVTVGTWNHFPTLIDLLARLEEKDVDVIAQAQDWFNNFVQTGQVWALIIGIVFGYMFRGFTSY